MKKSIIIALTLVLGVSIILSACNGNTLLEKTTTSTTTTSTTTTTTTTNISTSTTISKKDEKRYPTEAECIAKIKESYNEEFGNYVSISFDRYSDLSPIYRVTVSGHYSGEINLSSPVSSEYDGYGYITGVYVTISLSNMPYTAEYVRIVGHVAAIPVATYANNWGKYVGNTNTLFDKCETYKETIGAYVYNVPKKDIAVIISKNKVQATAAYGELECNMIYSLADSM